MTTPRPDAYLLQTDEKSAYKQQQTVDHVKEAPTGSRIPLSLTVQWVDSSGEPTKAGVISGTIDTIIEFKGEEPIVVFSTGERVSLAIFNE